MPQEIYLRVARAEEHKNVGSEGLWGRKDYAGLTKSLSFAAEWRYGEPCVLIVLACQPEDVVPSSEKVARVFARDIQLYEIGKPVPEGISPPQGFLDGFSKYIDGEDFRHLLPDCIIAIVPMTDTFRRLMQDVVKKPLTGSPNQDRIIRKLESYLEAQNDVKLSPDYTVEELAQELSGLAAM